MENIFIKEIINKSDYDKIPNIYYPNILINSVNNNDIQKELIIYDNKTDTDDYILIENENENKNDIHVNNDLLERYISEHKKVIKIIEFMLINLNIFEINILNYKIYNYDDNNTSKFIKNKISKRQLNIFDIKNFLLKNNVKREETLLKISIMTSKDYEIINKNTDNIKLGIYYIIIKILDIFNYYNKALLYSINLIKELNEIKPENLAELGLFIMLEDTNEIKIKHLNLIKNAYVKDTKKHSIEVTNGNYISIKKNENKKFVLSFVN